MGLWDIFRNNKLEESDKKYVAGINSSPTESKFDMSRDEVLQPTTVEDRVLPDIPEELFVERNMPNQAFQSINNGQNNLQSQSKMIPQSQPSSPVDDINLLYDYLNTDYEKQGYEDAMINPDTHSMNESLDNIKSKLFIVIAKVINYYKRHLRTIEFHIDSRGRSGMIDTVDELMSYKETAVDELKMVIQIEQDTINGKGLSQNLFNSYRKGFRNGLAAISFDSVLKRKV